MPFFGWVTCMALFVYPKLWSSNSLACKRSEHVCFIGTIKSRPLARALARESPVEVREAVRGLRPVRPLRVALAAPAARRRRVERRRRHPRQLRYHEGRYPQIYRQWWPRVYRSIPNEVDPCLIPNQLPYKLKMTKCILWKKVLERLTSNETTNSQWLA